MPRCKNGTRRNKKTGNCEKKSSVGTKRVYSPIKSAFPQLTSSDIENILKEYNITNTSDKRMLTKKLKKMKYNPNYESCWDGKPGRNLYEQATEKVSCWNKYGRGNFE
jgi:hypothetical protein